MKRPKVGVKVFDGQIQGVVGAGSVVIENLTFYSRASEEPAQTAGAEPIGPCPYPGLAYFGPSDANLFFGRDAAVARLTEAVGRHSFTALMGASGSGKSSVVLAGLAPRLHSDNAGNWRFSHFRIGTELESKTDPEIKPFRALARALVPFYVDSEDDTERLKNTNKLATNLKAGELTLGDVFAQSRSRNKGKRILLIADQFEEAFTLVADDGLRNRFIDVLLAGFPDPVPGGVPDICLVVTMRADFYGQALRYRPLADALQDHVENLGPMSRDELRAAIVTPAQNAKVSFESGLVETLLDKVESKPGSLPLLQFTLREMWGHLDNRCMTRTTYDAIGGFEGALSRRAQAIYDKETAKGQDSHRVMLFRRLFTRLVTLGEGAEDTRRIVGRVELGEEAWALAQRLAGEDNRLVVTTAPTADHETAEVVHEALIRHWPALIDWVGRDRAFQSWLKQLRPRLDEWSKRTGDDGTLLRGGPLVVAEEWRARRGDELSDEERAYVKASTAFREQEAHREDEARKAELRGQKQLAEEQQLRADTTIKLAREQRNRTWLAAALVIITALGGPWAYLELKKQRLVNHEAARTDIRGEIVAYAISSGGIALDTAPGHATSPYTTPLLKTLRQKDKSLIQALEDVHQEVNELSQGLQRPFLSTNMNGDVYLWNQPQNRIKRAIVVSVDNPGGRRWSRLKGPLNDADGVFALLQDSGFGAEELVRLHNVTKSEIEEHVEMVCSSLAVHSQFHKSLQHGLHPSFSDLIEANQGELLILTAVAGKKTMEPPPSNTLIFFFFSGHGIDIGGDNFLVPVLGQMPTLGQSLTKDGEEIAKRSVPVNFIISRLNRCSSANIVVLDTHFPSLFPF